MPEAIPTASAVTATATVNDLRSALMNSPLRRKKIVNGVTISRAAKGRQHVLHSCELHTRASGFLAATSFDLVQTQPVLIRQVLRLSLAHQSLDRRRRRIRRPQMDVACEVFEHAGHRLRRVGLVGADDPRRPTLDPSGRVLTDERQLALRVE